MLALEVGGDFFPGVFILLVIEEVEVELLNTELLKYYELNRIME